MEWHIYKETAIPHYRSASKYLAQLHQTLDDHALPYQTIAKVVQAFSNGRVLTTKVISECFTSVHTDMSVATPEQ